MRGLFLSLLLLNVAFFGWARWIDTPDESPAAGSQGAVPLLTLIRPASAATPLPVSPRCQHGGPDNNSPAVGEMRDCTAHPGGDH